MASVNLLLIKEEAAGSRQSAQKVTTIRRTAGRGKQEGKCHRGRGPVGHGVGDEVGIKETIASWQGVEAAWLSQLRKDGEVNLA